MEKPIFYNAGHKDFTLGDLHKVITVFDSSWEIFSHDKKRSIHEILTEFSNMTNNEIEKLDIGFKNSHEYIILLQTSYRDKLKTALENLRDTE